MLVSLELRSFLFDSIFSELVQMTHEEEFVEAVSNLIEAYFLWYCEAVGPASDILGKTKAELLRVVKNEAENVREK